MSGITNKDLEILGKFKLKIKKFLGVFPSDAMPNKKYCKSNFACIFNLSKHDEPGTHFVAIIKKHNKVIYFDPFGEKCSVEDINNFLQTLNKPITYNLVKIQDESSHSCGYFCIFAIYMLLKNKKSLVYLQKKFSKEKLKLNDFIVITNLINIFEKNKK